MMPFLYFKNPTFQNTRTKKKNAKPQVSQVPDYQNPHTPGQKRKSRHLPSLKISHLLSTT
jgi:hypothetical protein